MLAWTLFILHKLLMLLIGYSCVRVILGIGRRWHMLLASVFFLSQAVYGKCVATTIENFVRMSEGYGATSNEFILHNLLRTKPSIIMGRLVFGIIGVLLIVFWLETRLSKSPSTLKR